MTDASPAKRVKCRPFAWLSPEMWCIICSKIADPVDWSCWRRTCCAFAAVPPMYYHPFIRKWKEKNAQLEGFAKDGSLFLDGHFDSAMSEIPTKGCYFNSKSNGLLELAIRRGYHDLEILMLLSHPNTDASCRDYAAVVSAIRCGRLRLARTMLWYPREDKSRAFLYRRNGSQQRLDQHGMASFNTVKHVDRRTRQIIISAFRDLRADVESILRTKKEEEWHWSFRDRLRHMTEGRQCNESSTRAIEQIMCDFLGCDSILCEQFDEPFHNQRMRKATEFYMRRRFWETETSSYDHTCLIWVFQTIESNTTKDAKDLFLDLCSSYKI